MNSFYPLLPMVLADGMELPTYAHDGDAALDLSVTEDVVLRPNEYRMVSSGVAVAIPRGFVGGRSSLRMGAARARIQEHHRHHRFRLSRRDSTATVEQQRPRMAEHQAW